MGRRSARQIQLDTARDAKRRRSQSKEAKKKQKQRRHKQWNDDLVYLESLIGDFQNPKGKSRTEEENRIAVLVLVDVVRTRIRQHANPRVHEEDKESLSWSSIEKKVAEILHYDPLTVKEIRKSVMDDGDLPDRDVKPRGGAADGAKPPSNQLLQQEALEQVVRYVNSEHGKGSTVTNKKLRAHILKKLGVVVSRTTMQRTMRRLGLCWSAVKPKPRTLGAYRLEEIRNFLIELDELVRAMESGEESNAVLVFTDESYVHNTHASKFSYVPADKKHINRKTGRGRRLIIMHAITPDGPLCERDEKGVPYDTIEWNKAAPHPVRRPDGKLSCETLWLADSNKGDYHDNMNSGMFMKWVQDRLVPTFKAVYGTEKKMVLVCDNAPYHHSREIGSLASKSKGTILDMMVNDGVDYVSLPIEYNNRADLVEAEGDDVNESFDHDGETLRVVFDRDEQAQRSGMSRPKVASVDELKISYVQWLQEHKPERLECKVEAYLQSHRYRILWTPPYCPEIQPIEKYWAAGKNNVATHHYNGRVMTDTVQHLRDGWYGTFDRYDEDSIYYKRPVDCRKLWSSCLRDGGTMFIKMCSGISGTIGSLVVDENYIKPHVDLPIDTLVLDLTKEVVEDDDNSDEE